MLNLSLNRVDIAIVCSHYEESVRFYRDILELEVFVEIDIPEKLAQDVGLAPRGFHHMRLKAGDTLIKLMSIEAPPARRSADFAAGVRWLTFFVEDAQATYEELSARGVSFLSPPVPADDAAAVMCAPDPDGILIEFVQLLPEETASDGLENSEERS